ncbi:hypothetical protein HMPREF2626_01640 [Aerococcus sp. HMSC062A02]|uniref:glycoside hydrolase family 73 protein n=1 Tax=Aerococcus sp. HMSC062A02 TaxID=1715105 RepID=UPI0008A2FAE2|nr:glycoside hydrolase family 73 protein [Aerococcus sp. HMSC062A02]OFN02640.1 hypothetical protein HMPREF2626_01640 [Aerococcus sp. HMSC062A02]
MSKIGFQEDYINKIGTAAQKVAKNIYPSVTIAQAILESDWGRSSLARQYNNHFGIKGSYNGKTVRLGTSESNGQYYYNTVAGFRSYPNTESSVIDHENLFTSSTWLKNHYRHVLSANSPEAQCRALQGTYATDHRYASKLINIINTYNLKRFDKKTNSSSQSTAPKAETTSQTDTKKKLVIDNEAPKQYVGIKDIVYDDGRFFTKKGESRIYDREGHERWRRLKPTAGGYIMDYLNTDDDDPEKLFQKGLNYLKKYSNPSLVFTIKVSKIKDGLEKGDWIRIVDHDFSPALYIKARVLEIAESETNESLNEIKIGNYEVLESKIDPEIIALQKELKTIRQTWTEMNPAMLSIESSAGTSFINNKADTVLRAKIRKGSLDVTDNYLNDNFEWRRYDENGIEDPSWFMTGPAIGVNAFDIENRSTFEVTWGGETAQITLSNVKSFVASQLEPDDPAPGQQWLKMNDNGTIEKLTFMPDTNSWEAIPYENRITSSNGTIFKDNIVDTELQSTIMQNGVDRTREFDRFDWIRQGGQEDAAWNRVHENKGPKISISTADIYNEAKFYCIAYNTQTKESGVISDTLTIKNFIMARYEQAEEPKDAPEGALWTNTKTNELQIKKNGEFIPVITQIELEKAIEEIELKPGPPGQDGEDGAPGKDGRDGQDGKPAYAHWAYANSADGREGFTRKALPGRKYIGVYSDHIKEDSNDPSKYEWSLYTGKDGEDGLPGPKGDDGESSYIHTAWANSADGRQGFSTSDASGRSYMGTAITNNKSDPIDPSAYIWQRTQGIKGEKGDQGPKGIPGDKSWTWIKFSDGPNGEGMSDSPVGKTYIGISENNSSERKSNNPKDYYWFRAKGEKGVPGESGWTWIKYADDPNGNGMSDDPTNKKYIGYAYNKSTPSKSTDKDDYYWSLIPEEMENQINSKASEISLAEAQERISGVSAIVEQLPSGEELYSLQNRFTQAEVQLKHLENARESDKADLEHRLKVIEANVGAGQLFIEAIKTNLSFAEEGLQLGRKDNPLKVNIDNEKISFLDSGKEVAFISGQMLWILSGVFINSLAFGNHKAYAAYGSTKITIFDLVGGS